MKKLLTLTFIFLLTITVQAQEENKAIRLSEPVQVTDTYEVFGAEVSNVEKPVTLSKAIANQASEAQDVVVKTRIAQVCQKKGCFFIAEDGATTARITFKDYGFFIPTDSQGKEVTIVGNLSKKVISEKDAKHYAEDTGKDADAIKGDQVEYAIVATSVIIQKGK